jgi:hypothetical protein
MSVYRRIIMFGEKGSTSLGGSDAWVAQVEVAGRQSPKKVDDAPSERKAHPTNSAPPWSSFRGTWATAERNNDITLRTSRGEHQACRR